MSSRNTYINSKAHTVDYGRRYNNQSHLVGRFDPFGKWWWAGVDYFKR